MRTPSVALAIGRTLVVALAVLCAACGGGGNDTSSATQPLPFPTLAPARALSYSGMPSIFDRRRNRFYALTANQIIAVDPSTGSQTVLVPDAADAPRGPTDINQLNAGPFNLIALSASGDYLFIATSSDKLARLNLTTGQIDQRLDLPTVAAGSSRGINAVVDSSKVDQDVYVVYSVITPVGNLNSTLETWLTKVEGSAWSQQRLQLEHPGDVLTMKPDDSEILTFRYLSGFRKIRIGSNGTLAFDGVAGVVAQDPYYTSAAPTYVGTGILFKNAVYDGTTLTKLYDIPAVSCSVLANQSHLICVGPGRPSHALLVYDLVLRQILTTWTAGLPPPASGLDPARPTGWVSEAGPNRVLVHYAWNIYKGFNGTGLYSYEHSSLN